MFFVHWCKESNDHKNNVTFSIPDLLAFGSFGHETEIEWCYYQPHVMDPSADKKTSKHGGMDNSK
jgi:hypothetical protein